MSGAPRTVVVGGGLAGIAAAVRLADAGCDVVLLEARPRLGGQAGSFDRDGLRVDTGQHVLLRCYQGYRGLLRRMDVAHLVPLQGRLEIPVLLAGRPPALLRRASRGPAPLHLLPMIARYTALSPAQRWSAVRAAAALRDVDPGDPASDAVTFGQWLTAHGQDERTISRLWGLVTVATLNLEPAQACLALAATVFRTGLLDAVDAGDLGVPQVPLSELHDVAARHLLTRLGVQVRTGVKVRHIEGGVGDRAEVEGRAGGSAGRYLLRTEAGGSTHPQDIRADAVVVAVPHQQAARLVPVAAAPARGTWDGLGASPILNLHVHYDRRVSDLPFAAAPESAVQWVFDRTASAGVTRGQYLVTSVSAADDVIASRSEQVRRTQLAALGDLLPAARHARVLDAFVTREPRATFRQGAGTARLRPGARTAAPGLALAGAWTATGLPDTMEGAVRSGVTAADTVLATVLATTLPASTVLASTVPAGEGTRSSHAGLPTEVTA